ncbi:carbon storage regulator CsrA [Pseudomonas sp.]|uniref:carbon storage regulator CsrA n=1 Tax=Pseudomonas sp. TaxID=306 RepID=UPI002625E35F|nr:carbon storage regulator CsrA [Pseudomonas sp.]
MLVLSRAIGKTISIGDDITLHILEVSAHHVKFGIEAPAAVSVHRAEVYRKIQERQAAATRPLPAPNP